MYIDTHAHLYLENFSGDIEKVINSALEIGVEWILLPNIDPDTIVPLHHLVDKFPDLCCAMMGLHPCSVDHSFQKKLDIIFSHLEESDYVAIGEIGIDLYWDKRFLHQQMEAFELQVRWAATHHKPIVIHSRESINLILEILESLALPDLTGVFHCFTGTINQAERIMNLGFYMGIGGVVTFKNSKLPQALAQIPISHIVLETDAPYLAPHPFRGKRNESAYLIHIARKMAEILHIPVDEVGNMTSENAKKLFHLPPISA